MDILIVFGSNGERVLLTMSPAELNKRLNGTANFQYVC